MRKAPLILSLTAGILLLSAQSCEDPDYCNRDLDPPTEAMAQATREGAEVEKEFDVRVSGESQTVECVVQIHNQDARWFDATDDV